MSVHPRYELLDQIQIGEGDLGVVWRGRDLVVGQEVAVKVLREAVRSDPHRLRPVMDGARFLTSLDDREHFVRVLDLDEKRGWVVMEYLPGNLAAQAREGPMPAEVVREVVRQALEALEVLHRHGRLHGGVKPGNLLLTARGTVKLGESALIDLNDESGEVRRPEGLPKYFAPELTDPTFGPVGPPADLYALGLTALELLVGPTFEGLFPGVGPDAADPEVGWLRVHGGRDEGLPAVRSLVPGAPRDLAEVIDRLLAREVKDRYATAREALDDLPALTGPGAAAVGSLVATTGREVPAPRPAPPAAPPRPRPRPGPGPGPGAVRPWWKRGAVVYPAVAALVAVALVMAVMFSPADEEPAALRVESTPEGAAIYFEGKDSAQKTNVDLKVRPGKRVVRLELAGYEPEERTVELGPGDAKTMQIALRRSPPPKPRPEEKKATGRKETEKTPIVKKETEKKAVVKKETEKKGTEKPPPPAEVVVKVASSPAGASVLVDGEERGKTPLALKLRPGEYAVLLRYRGHEDHKESIEVKAGAEAPGVDAVLVPLPPPLVVTNSLGMKLRRVEPPAGGGAVRRPYHIGVTEVTQAQYEAVMKANPSVFGKDNGGGPDHPVEFVSYAMAVKFCEALSALPAERKAGRAYRLPTEAEWEHAARAGSKGRFAGGDEKEDLGAVGWYKENSGRRTRAVGGKRPNAWGLYDVHGNVMEWCSGAEKGEDGKPRHVLRGGAFNLPAEDCAVGARRRTGPASQSNAYGLRVVCDVAG